jgi:hypothetical protein
MTHVDLARFEAAQLQSLKPWLSRVLNQVESKVDDARAHAVKAVTDTLKQTPDGRPTLRRAGRSRSVLAAFSRLDELWDALCGPTNASLSGRIRDARAAFYAESFERWKPWIPSELWVGPDPHPTVENLKLARTYPIHGYDVRQEFSSPFQRAKISLQAAVTLAGRQSTSDHISTGIIDGWSEKTRQSLFVVAKSSLSDGQKWAETKAGRDLVHSDYLDDSPLE